MTLSTQINTSVYTGDGSTTEFSFPYLFYANGDLNVSVAGDAKTLNGGGTYDYTVSGAGNDAGGTITFNNAPVSGAQIIIQRVVAYVQNTDFENFDGNPADVTEKQFDLVVMMAQQISEQSNRTILAPIGTSLTSNTITGTIDSTDRIVTLSTAGPKTSTISDLSSNLDVVITSEASGDLLMYDGTNWANESALTGDYVFSGAITFSGVVDVTNVNAATSAGGSLRTAGGTNCLSWGGGGSANLTAGGNLSMGTTHKIVNCADPSSAQDVATKAYVDAEIAANPSTIIQAVYADRTTVFTTTTQIPYDDTIPQNTEGGELITATITPTNASNKLRITVDFSAAISSAAYIIGALFQDSAANALAARVVYGTVNGQPLGINLVYEMTAGTTSATTFKVRVGGNAAGTTVVNGLTTGLRRLGGVDIATITIEEIAV